MRLTLWEAFQARILLASQSDWPAIFLKTHVGLTGLVSGISGYSNCFIFTGASEQLLQKPNALESVGVGIAGWKLDAPGYGYSEALRYQPGWAEAVLSDVADTLMLACDSSDTFSRQSSAASTIEFPPVTVVVEGQRSLPAVEADFTATGAVDLRVMAGEAVSSPRAGLFVLEPEPGSW
jgi:hypothetical protein